MTATAPIAEPRTAAGEAAVVHPQLISELAGPLSPLGVAAIPLLFDAVRLAESRLGGEITKTALLYAEWRRLFGQVAGVQSDRLRGFLADQSAAHARDYAAAPSAYLFALYTYLAVVAKLVAAMSLPGASQQLSDPLVPIRRRMSVLESGELFTNAGIVNMLSGDFFSWYLGDACWGDLAGILHDLTERLAAVDFRVTRKSPESTRDLFKGLYQTFVPGPLRHALGEFYTPDWMAEHALDVVEWQPGDDLLDPTCGSGTFLLEALRRRLCHPGNESATAGELLDGLHGFDLNPLAVLAARASLVVFLGERFRSDEPVRLPVFLADAIDPAVPREGIYEHELQTEKGPIGFAVPAKLVERDDFFDVFESIRRLAAAGVDADRIVARAGDALRDLDQRELGAFAETVRSLVRLHDDRWDGIWCTVLAERFAAAAVPPAGFVAGNPPWVKWSDLPPEYATFIKPHCEALGVFGTDTWVGGIESDISTVVTYETLRSRLAENGILAFFITGTVFANESSQGFRRFRLPGSDVTARVLVVEDFSELRPFDGVSNHPTLLVLRRDGETTYPVPYRAWRLPGEGRRRRRGFASADEFRRETIAEELSATPVPGTDAGPWLKGTAAQHEVWTRIFGAQSPRFRARKGVTTDLNGVFFVHAAPQVAAGGLVSIANDPDLGRNRAVPRVTTAVETEHLFPLLRGRGVQAFRATPEPDLRILVPQRGMHGDPDLPLTAPRTHRYLERFRDALERRSSLRRYQRGKPYWSLWSTGPYTFSDFKVVWKEMSGRRFAAAYVGPLDDPVIGRKPVVCDHKLYLVPCGDEEEAAFLTAVLNAPTVSTAISAYAAQLSLGANVVEYLDIPAFDAARDAHRELASLGIGVTRGTVVADDALYRRLDEVAGRLLGYELIS